jgi:hypothetical protein
MSTLDILIAVTMVFSLAFLRFGLPLLVMWLVRSACCRLFPAQV